MSGPDDNTIAGRLMRTEADMAEYQRLKEAREREIEAARRLFESERRKHGEAYARAFLRSKGYDIDSLR